MVWMDEVGEVVIGQLLDAIAEHPPQRWIPLDDAAVEVDPRDAHRRPVEDRPKAFLALAQRVLDLLALRDIAKAGHDLGRLTVWTDHRDRVEQQPAFSAGRKDDSQRDVHWLPA